jgi:SAM-dependent methyltransferase
MNKQNSQDKYDKLADKIIKKYADYEREEFEDRNVLERKIFPWVLAELEPETILDIGREEYQKFYNHFFTERELWSMDFDPKRKKWGAKNHITGDAVDVSELFKEKYFDVVFMNGVFGWGLNEPAKIEKCFAAIYKILKPGGFFVLGYNDWDALPMKVEDIKNLKKLKPFVFPPLNSEKFKCINGEHTYRFYKKD